MSRATDQAYARIRAAIVAGTLPAGAAVGEDMLADLCGVSRTPVREAMRRLEADLLLRRASPKRLVVADWSPGDIDEMFALRALLEGHAAARAAPRFDAAGLDALALTNAALGVAIAAPAGPDIPGFLAANRAFHDGVVRAAASPRLAAMLAKLIEQPVVQRTARLYDRAQLARSHAEHEELLAAFARADADWARAVMTGHIRRAFHTFAEAR